MYGKLTDKQINSWRAIFPEWECVLSDEDIVDIRDYIQEKNKYVFIKRRRLDSSMPGWRNR